MIAEILCVGTELLMGQVLNTNAQYIARRLCALGVRVLYQSVVGDNEKRLEEAYREALSRSDLVITSGGLGPTVDDITKKVAARVAGKELVVREEAAQMVKERFGQYHRKMTENNVSQAMFTEDTQILFNPNGTAPGAIVPLLDGKFIVHLPGPPIELEPMFRDQVEPWIMARTGMVLCSRYIRIFGMGESEVDMRLQDLETGENPTLSPYCSLGEVMLRATASARTEEEALSLLGPLIEEIRRRLGDVIYAVDSDDQGSLARAAVSAMRDRGLTVACAESLTGGRIASTIVDIPGASEVLRGGFVTYQTQTKTQLLGVPEQLIDECTVVSPEVACAMAKGAREKLGTDLAVSATGIAGPDGGTPECPVGTVYLGIASRNGVRAHRLQLSGSRDRIRTLTVKHALHILRKEAETAPAMT